jgi:hypothetical protein
MNRLIIVYRLNLNSSANSSTVKHFSSIAFLYPFCRELFCRKAILRGVGCRDSGRLGRFRGAGSFMSAIALRQSSSSEMYPSEREEGEDAQSKYRNSGNWSPKQKDSQRLAAEPACREEQSKKRDSENPEQRREKAFQKAPGDRCQTCCFGIIDTP